MSFKRIKSINKSTLFNEGDTQQCSTDKLVALEFPIELEFRNVGFDLNNPFFKFCGDCSAVSTVLAVFKFCFEHSAVYKK